MRIGRRLGNLRSNKYRNKKLDTPYGKFDSKKEYNRYMTLQYQQQNGKIKNLQRQVRYNLLPSQYVDGKCVERGISYIADFVYEQDGKTVIEDVKGYRTDVYKIKRKLMLYIHGVLVKEI